MSDWYGYPQHPDAHPERPWWRKSTWGEVPIKSIGYFGDRWFRIDIGYPTDEANLARVDRERPLPAPEPKCGQVWVWPTGDQDTIVGVMFHDGAPAAIAWGTDQLGDKGDPELFPPYGAVLVAGPGAPWAPMGGDDE